MLELQHISYETEENREILHDISLTIQDRFVAITGPNGGGKSTLAKIIAGIYTPTSGRILLDGEDITALSITERARRGISYAFQQPVRFKGLRVGDLMNLAAGKDANIAEVCAYLSEVGLCARDYIDRELDASLSGGERQRVWIAMALAQEPKILILDEPTTYLDVCHQLEVMELVSRLNREENLTVVMVLHEINQAVRYSTDLLVLENGIIQRHGPPMEVMTHEAIAEVFDVDADVEMRKGRPMICINGLLDKSHT